MKFWGSAAIWAALFVGACASGGNDVLRTQDATAVNQNIVDGKTTRGEVERIYGFPTATSFADSRSEIWVYRWGRSTSHPENFIPIVGGLVASNDVQKKELVIIFNDQNIVARHSMRETSETVRSNLLSSSSSNPASSGLNALPPTLAAASSPSATATPAATGGRPGARPRAAASATGTPGAPLDGGSWSCTVYAAADPSKARYLIEFLISRDGTITVLSYGNAPATLVWNDPLTYSAVNPRGARLTTFTLNSNNSIVVSGATVTDPNVSFHDEGTCTGMPLATAPKS
jgi:hypothetical protein